MERARHVLRIVFLLLVVLAGFTVAMSLLRPPSYGMYGPYRYDNVAEQRAKPVIHHGAKSCMNCHPKQWKLREEGEAHLAVSCEACHGPLARHATGDRKDVDKKIGEMPVDKTFRLCAKCHRKLDARPKAFPQVDLDDEKHTKGEKIEGAVCKGCHDPHSTSYEEEAPPAEEKKAEEKTPEEKKPEEKKEGAK